MGTAQATAIVGEAQRKKEEGPDWPGEIRKTTARPLQTVGLGFSAKLPPSRFPSPCHPSRRGLLWVPPWLELMPTMGYICSGPSCTSLLAVHVAAIPCLQLRAGVRNFKFIKITFVHPFWKRKCLTACFTHRAEQTHSASADRAPEERNEYFVYDRFLFLFPRFRSKLLQKCRQNLQYLPQHYSSSNLGATDQHVKDSS